MRGLITSSSNGSAHAAEPKESASSPLGAVHCGSEGAGCLLDGGEAGADKERAAPWTYSAWLRRGLRYEESLAAEFGAEELTTEELRLGGAVPPRNRGAVDSNCDVVRHRMGVMRRARPPAVGARVRLRARVQRQHDG